MCWGPTIKMRPWCYLAPLFSVSCNLYVFLPLGLPKSWRDLIHWLSRQITDRFWPMPQNEGFGTFISDYFHHDCWKFCILMVWNAPRMKDLSHSSQTIFTMIEGNFGFWWSEIPQNEDLNHSSQTVFTMVEGFCGFLWSEMPQNEGFKPVISDYFHRGWRKLDFYGLKCHRMKDLNQSSQTIFTVVERNYGFLWSEMP